MSAAMHNTQSNDQLSRGRGRDHDAGTSIRRGCHWCGSAKWALSRCPPRLIGGGGSPAPWLGPGTTSEGRRGRSTTAFTQTAAGCYVAPSSVAAESLLLELLLAPRHRPPDCLAARTGRNRSRLRRRLVQRRTIRSQVVRAARSLVVRVVGSAGRRRERLGPGPLQRVWSAKHCGRASQVDAPRPWPSVRVVLGLSIQLVLAVVDDAQDLVALGGEDLRSKARGEVLRACAALVGRGLSRPREGRRGDHRSRRPETKMARWFSLRIAPDIGPRAFENASFRLIDSFELAVLISLMAFLPAEEHGAMASCGIVGIAAGTDN